MINKESLFQYCMDYVKARMATIQDEIQQAQTSANEETKSSAGDKYETGRAMAQLGIEMNTSQLMETNKLLSVLNSLHKNPNTDLVGSGSLVTTSNGIFFIAISIGVVKLEEINYFIISPESPMGKLMVGRRVGEEISLNNKTYSIRSIE